MENTISFRDVIGAKSGDKEHMLGKFLYFSLANILIDKEVLSELCDSMDIPYSGGKRVSVSDAFRSATGDIKERIVSKQSGRIYQIYCRDNEHSADTFSRELVKETLNQKTNQYDKLANIHYDRADCMFGYDNLSYDTEVDALKYCRQAEELFELYQKCANRKQIETICVGYLRSLEATKVSINGHLYFVPRHTMEKVDIFESFIEELGNRNRNNTPLTANSFYIIDDAKQREKMTAEFYLAVRKEIAEYQERADYLIQSGSNSPTILERWALKIQALEDKKRHYEQILRRELTELDDDFETLKFLSQELTIRARGLRFQKRAA